MNINTLPLGPKISCYKFWEAGKILGNLYVYSFLKALQITSFKYLSEVRYWPEQSTCLVQPNIPNKNIL